MRHRNTLVTWTLLLASCGNSQNAVKDGGDTDAVAQGSGDGSHMDVGSMDAARDSAGRDFPGSTADAPSGSGDGGTDRETDGASGPPRGLDILFMIDNSPSMRAKQENLARSFPAFIEGLSKARGLPDLRIGIVSSDVGAKDSPDGNCNNFGGDRGSFQVLPRCGLDPKTSLYLVSLNHGANNNFTGNIGDVFGCMAKLGIMGCGYEHQLQAIRFGLYGAFGINPENAGFVRRDAYLAIILLTDKDDCSAPPNSDLFSTPTAPGHAARLRCALRGHLCGGSAPPAAEFATPLSQCQSNEKGDLVPVTEFVADIKRLKAPGTDRIFVAAITGWDPAPGAQYRIGKNTTGDLDYLPACTAPISGSATPAIRIKQFVDGFGSNGVLQSICNDDFGPAMGAIGTKLASLVAP